MLIGDDSTEVAMRNTYQIDVEGRWPDGRREVITVEIGDGPANPGDPDGDRSADDAQTPGEAFRIPGLNRESGEPLDVRAGPVRIRIAA